MTPNKMNRNTGTSLAQAFDATRTDSAADSKDGAAFDCCCLPAIPILP